MASTSSPTTNDIQLIAPPNSPILTTEGSMIAKVGKAKVEKAFTFPCYAPISSGNEYAEQYGGAEFFLCLYRELDSEASDFCGESCRDFSELIQHLNHFHGLDLKEKIHYCLICNEIFENALQGIDHHINKALSYEDFDFPWKTAAENQEVKRWLDPYFQTMKSMKKDILDFLLFSNEELPYLEDNLLAELDNHDCCK